MNRLKKNKKFFNKLKHANLARRKQLIKIASPDEIKSLCDMCYNIVSSNINLTPHQLRKLKRKKTVIRKLANKKISLSDKRRLIQRGGFLSIIAPLLGTLASTILGALNG